MIKGIKVFAIFFSFLLLNGCASSCGSSVETNTNTNQGVNKVIVPKQATNVKVPNTANTTNMVNGAANKNLPNPATDESKVKVITPDTSKKVEPPKRKLAGNSELSVKSVGAKFVETRQFIDHPQLDKIERIIEGKDSEFKVYLKNGKTYDLDKDKFKDYKKESAESILKAVGVTPVKTNVDKINNSTEKKK